MSIREKALGMLRAAVGSSSNDVEFRAGQWEAIEAVVERRARVLVVQRTGWGKSMVYFIATRLLRDAGSGPTIVISPLLSLMRDQIQAAQRVGIQALTVNSTNTEEWAAIEERLRANQVDLLIVSPERLTHPQFVDWLEATPLAEAGLLVVDEAHCISDWGHDFRPDYQRIRRLVAALPPNVPLLSTTATANDRVVADIASQFGPDLEIQRGPLTRASLRLQNIRLPDLTSRLVWLAEQLPGLPGSGIVYTLTKRDAERVAAWLTSRGIAARPYHASTEDRPAIEEELRLNSVKAVVATVALGMGFDKPDLGFVVHFQVPQSVVHYYQQVGRAGRAIPEAHGVLLSGAEDDDINRYFIERAFPQEWEVQRVLDAVADSRRGLTSVGLETRANLRRSQIEKIVKHLSLGDTPPIRKDGRRWVRTPHAYSRDEAHIQRLAASRTREWEQMQAYVDHEGCLMEFLARALDDPHAGPCGRCQACSESLLLPDHVSHEQTLRDALEFMRRTDIELEPRRRWNKGSFPKYGWQGAIGDDLRVEAGRALCYWMDPGLGDLVRRGIEELRFDDELVAASSDLVRRRWGPAPAPTWITSVPSQSKPELVAGFARRLAKALGLPYRDAVRKVRQTEPQRNMRNSYHQARNLDGAFAVRPDAVAEGPVLLVDDMTDSRWTFTVIGALLREAGSGPVYPFALAHAGAG